MTPELIQAIGQHIVGPICAVGAFAAFLYFITKD